MCSSHKEQGPNSPVWTNSSGKMTQEEKGADGVKFLEDQMWQLGKFWKSQGYTRLPLPYQFLLLGPQNTKRQSVQ